MVQLKREGRLLRTIGGKPHASDEDHEAALERVHAKPIHTIQAKRRTAAEESFPTPDSVRSSESGTSSGRKVQRKEMEDDFDRDPESSSDAEDVKQSISANSSFRKPDVFDVPESPDKPAKRFSLPGSSQGSVKTKRKSSFDEDLPDEWKPIKRRNIRIQAPSRITNIHAKPVMYGKGGAKRQASAESGFKKKSPIKSKTSHEKKVSGFKVLPAWNLPESKTSSFKSSFSADDSAQAVTNEEEFAELDDTSSLSSVGSPEPDARDYGIFVRCGICENTQVPKMIYEEFTARHSLSEPIPFTWKRRFCDYHRRERAKEMWAEKGYPNIDWSRIQGRMRKHDEFLISILNNTTGSYYRTVLREKLQPRNRNGSAQQVWKAEEEKPGSSVGYYGPRGAKLMTDHIMEALSDDLRERATVDKLLSSSGIQGGMTGFVQAVLVPHLAELLIKDDMKLSEDWSQQARTIISESAEAGELLHPEMRDRNQDVEESETDEDDDDA